MELSNNLNYIPSFLKTIIFDNESNQIKFLLIFILIAGILSYLHGMIKENVINGEVLYSNNDRLDVNNILKFY